MSDLVGTTVVGDDQRRLAGLSLTAEGWMHLGKLLEEVEKVATKKKLPDTDGWKKAFELSQKMKELETELAEKKARLTKDTQALADQSKRIGELANELGDLREKKLLFDDFRNILGLAPHVTNGEVADKINKLKECEKKFPERNKAIIDIRVALGLPDITEISRVVDEVRELVKMVEADCRVIQTKEEGRTLKQVEDQIITATANGMIDGVPSSIMVSIVDLQVLRRYIIRLQKRIVSQDRSDEVYNAGVEQARLRGRALLETYRNSEQVRVETGVLRTLLQCHRKPRLTDIELDAYKSVENKYCNRVPNLAIDIEPHTLSILLKVIERLIDGSPPRHVTPEHLQEHLASLRRNASAPSPGVVVTDELMLQILDYIKVLEEGK